MAAEVDDKTRSGAAEVTINVIDVNDETPIFDSLQYVFTIQENEKIGTEVGTVVAIDKDEGDEIT